MKSSSPNYELPNQYFFHVQSVLGYYKPFSDGGETFIIETGNTASETIMNYVIENARDENSKKILGVIEGFNKIILDKNKISINPESTFEQYEKSLEQLLEYTNSENRTLILGFSSMGGYELLPRLSKIIKKLKEKNPNIIFIMGGADFNAIPDKKFLDQVFDEYGIDIVNIGGAKEFSEFLGGINESDLFFRDENGNIGVKSDREIPKSLIFKSKKDNTNEIKAGTKLNSKDYYNPLTRMLYFTIPNNPCLNNCSYCANFIHSNTPLKDHDIETAIKEYEIAISKIEEDKFGIELGNPNPMQYIDKFENFIQNIDLSRVIEFGFFGDFMGISNDKLLEKTCNIIDYLNKKYPELKITIHFGVDALHHKGDGEFLGRSQGHKIIEEPKYIASLKNFDKLFERYKNNPNIGIPFNLIFHPNLEINGYKDRFEFTQKYVRNKTGAGLFPLVPHPNSKIEQDHKGYYIPEYEAINGIDLTKYANINYWGYFYLNSKLLDIFTFLRTAGIIDIFYQFIFSKSEKNEEVEIDDFEKIITIVGKKIEQNLDKLNSFRSKILFIRRKKQLKNLEITIDKIIDYLNFIIYRENYIKEINPSYNSEESVNFIESISWLKNKFEEIKKDKF
ncbi:MAG: hypothetical protein PHH98_02915 [Candidatus Gracilibacteria bacterium]|nr:hypothetical protein [Candidatus Gracilibacteria bacterium]